MQEKLRIILLLSKFNICVVCHKLVAITCPITFTSQVDINYLNYLNKIYNYIFIRISIIKLKSY